MVFLVKVLQVIITGRKTESFMSNPQRSPDTTLPRGKACLSCRYALHVSLFVLLFVALTVFTSSCRRRKMVCLPICRCYENLSNKELRDVTELARYARNAFAVTARTIANTRIIRAARAHKC